MPSKRRSPHLGRSRFVQRMFKKDGYGSKELDSFMACAREVYNETGMALFLNWLRSPIHLTGSKELQEFRFELFCLAWKHDEVEQERTSKERAAAAEQKRKELVQQAIDREEAMRAACRRRGDWARAKVTRPPLTLVERMERSFEASLDALLEEVR